MMYNYLNLKIKFLFGMISLSVLFFSCDKDESPGEYSNGIFIVNEGGYGNNNGSVSFYSYSTDSIFNNIFFNVNNRSLGDVVQSVTVHNNKAYIVVNNSNKVEIADRNTFKAIGVISDVSLPRYLVVKDNIGYLSCWGDNSVKVIDLETNMVTQSIPVASGPEKMCIVDDKLYVVNTGGFSVDSVVSVIDLTSLEVVKNIIVKFSPQDIVIDKDNKIWVLCFGKVVYDYVDPYPIIEESPSKIYEIDLETDELITEGELFQDQHPTQLEVSNDGILYLGGGYTFAGIYRLEIEAGSGTLTRIVTDYVYGFNIDPGSNIMYTLQAPTYTDPGILKRFELGGTLLGTYECGIGPNSASFKSTPLY